MRAFLQSLDENVWQAVKTSWTKPKEVSTDWDDAKFKAANFNNRALNDLFSAVTNEEFKKISSRQPMKGLRLSRIQNLKSLLRALKRLRWRRMSR